MVELMVILFNREVPLILDGESSLYMCNLGSASLIMIYINYTTFYWNRDPVFEPLEGKGKTYAQMDKDDKNEISHRGRSFAKFKSFLLSQNLS